VLSIVNDFTKQLLKHHLLHTIRVNPDSVAISHENKLAVLDHSGSKLQNSLQNILVHSELSSLSVYPELHERHFAFPAAGSTSVQLLQLANVRVLHSVPATTTIIIITIITVVPLAMNTTYYIHTYL